MPSCKLAGLKSLVYLGLYDKRKSKIRLDELEIRNAEDIESYISEEIDPNIVIYDLKTNKSYINVSINFNGEYVILSCTDLRLKKFKTFKLTKNEIIERFIVPRWWHYEIG